MRSRSRWITSWAVLGPLTACLTGCCAGSGEPGERRQRSSQAEVERRHTFQAATGEELTDAQRGAIVEMLTDGRLAPLPEAAQQLRFGSWSGFFTGASYLRFEADPQQIQQFLNRSVSLAPRSPQRFGPDRQNLPSSAQTTESSPRHRYFQHDPVYPWYDPTLRGAGRRYEIPLDSSRHNSGEVVVDDERNVVWVSVIWS